MPSAVPRRRRSCTAQAAVRRGRVAAADYRSPGLGRHHDKHLEGGRCHARPFLIDSLQLYRRWMEDLVRMAWAGQWHLLDLQCREA
jgi:hypothetical protein